MLSCPWIHPLLLGALQPWEEGAALSLCVQHPIRLSSQTALIISKCLLLKTWPITGHVFRAWNSTTVFPTVLPLCFLRFRFIFKPSWNISYSTMQWRNFTHLSYYNHILKTSSMWLGSITVWWLVCILFSPSKLLRACHGAASLGQGRQPGLQTLDGTLQQGRLGVYASKCRPHLLPSFTGQDILLSVLTTSLVLIQC